MSDAQARLDPDDSSDRDAGAASVAPQGWRRIVGVSLFVLHLILPVIAMVLVPILGLPSGTNTLLIGASFVGGPDVLLIAAIAILGKDGVTELMGKLGSVVRRVTKWDAVTERRYRIGLWVLVISLLLPTVILFFWHDSVKEIGGQPGWAFWVLLASTFAFIGAVMSMGHPSGSESRRSSRGMPTSTFPLPLPLPGRPRPTDRFGRQAEVTT